MKCFNFCQIVTNCVDRRHIVNGRRDSLAYLRSSLSYTQEQHEYSIATTRDDLMILLSPVLINPRINEARKSLINKIVIVNSLGLIGSV